MFPARGCCCPFPDITAARPCFDGLHLAYSFLLLRRTVVKPSLSVLSMFSILSLSQGHFTGWQWCVSGAPLTKVRSPQRSEISHSPMVCVLGCARYDHHKSGENICDHWMSAGTERETFTPAEVKGSSGEWEEAGERRGGTQDGGEDKRGRYCGELSPGVESIEPHHYESG